jgi:anti-anti-sigma factor
MSTHPHPAYQSATFTTRMSESSVAIVTVAGELDFTNTEELIGTATHVADGSTDVVIDLSGVEFFGTAGFTALHALNEQYTAQHIRWAVVPSRNVDRVVRICDTESVVPLRRTLELALAG